MTIAPLTAFAQMAREIKGLLAEGTPGALIPIRSGTTTREAALAYIAAAMESHPDAHGLIALGLEGQYTDDGTPRCIAIVGNGPDAWPNARRLAISAEAAPHLLDQIAALLAVMTTASQLLAAGHVAEAQQVLAKGADSVLGGITTPEPEGETVQP